MMERCGSVSATHILPAFALASNRPRQTVVDLTVPRRAYQIHEPHCDPTYGWSSVTDGGSVRMNERASSRRMRRGEVVMTLSHEPWLVLLPKLVAAKSSYLWLLVAGILDEAEGFLRRTLRAGALPTQATGARPESFLGVLAAQFPLPIGHFFSKSSVFSYSRDWRGLRGPGRPAA